MKKEKSLNYSLKKYIPKEKEYDQKNWCLPHFSSNFFHDCSFSLQLYQSHMANQSIFPGRERQSYHSQDE